MMRLYNFHWSSASFRVRIALALKGIEDVELVDVNLREGEQRHPEYLVHAPDGLVPTLEDDALTLSQSLAIIQYLDDRHPHPRLIPAEPAERALAWQLALLPACDIHPLNNLRVLRYLEGELGVDEAGRKRWYAHWISLGFAALEQYVCQLGREGPFCLGTTLSIADICLIPQIRNAVRFEVPLERFARLRAIDAHCRTLPAFAKAALG